MQLMFMASQIVWNRVRSFFQQQVTEQPLTPVLQRQPSARQILQQDQKQSLLQKCKEVVDKLKEELEKIKIAKDKVLAKLKDIKKRLVAIKKSIETLDRNIYGSRRKVNFNSLKVDKLKKKIEEIKDKIKQLEKVPGKEKEIEELKKEEKEIRKDLDKLNEEIETELSSIKKFEKEIKDLGAKIIPLESEELKYKLELARLNEHQSEVEEKLDFATGLAKKIETEKTEDKETEQTTDISFGHSNFKFTMSKDDTDSWNFDQDFSSKTNQITGQVGKETFAYEKQEKFKYLMERLKAAKLHNLQQEPLIIKSSFIQDRLDKAANNGRVWQSDPSNNKEQGGRDNYPGR